MVQRPQWLQYIDPESKRQKWESSHFIIIKRNCTIKVKADSNITHWINVYFITH